jgi:hypothetical protein
MTVCFEDVTAISASVQFCTIFYAIVCNPRGKISCAGGRRFAFHPPDVRRTSGNIDSQHARGTLSAPPALVVVLHNLSADDSPLHPRAVVPAPKTYS